VAIRPAIYHLLVQRRADYPLCLRFKSAVSGPINLAGWTVVAQVWNKARTVKYADFSVSYIDRADGRVDLLLSDEATSALPSEAFYDVLLINPGGAKEYYLEGTVYTSEGYSA
jgi:hypothetical protein